MGAWEMHHRSTKTRPTKPCLRRMVDPHLIASGVCEKERKSEHNSSAAGKGVGTMPPSHLTAKRDRRRTQRRRAVASQTTSAMRPPRRRGGRRVPAAGPSSVAGPARPSWPARLPTREDRERGQVVGKMACLRTLHGDFTAERVGSTTRRLHQCVRLAILYRIDTWYVF